MHVEHLVPDFPVPLGTVHPVPEPIDLLPDPLQTGGNGYREVLPRLRQPVDILLAVKPLVHDQMQTRKLQLPELIQQTGETLHVGDGTRQETVRHGQPALLSVHHGEIDLRQLLTVAVVPPTDELVQFRVGGDRRDVVAEKVVLADLFSPQLEERLPPVLRHPLQQLADPLTA